MDVMGARENVSLRSSSISPLLVPDNLPLRVDWGAQEQSSDDLFMVDYTSYCLNLHECVRASGLPNFRSTRRAVVSHLHITKWREYLQHYFDNIVCDFLEFGWPIDYQNSTFPVTDSRTHLGALQYPTAVDAYLSTEILQGAVIGPFASNPFSSDIATSPLNSVPKVDSSERRIILDLSWPPGTSVNDGISSHSYLGQDFDLYYPTVDLIASKVNTYGRGCLLFKRDLKRAYRQFPVGPGDYNLLGYCWHGNFYFDTVLPMGLRMAAMACQRIPRSVCFICEQSGYDVVSYLDNFICVSLPSEAPAAYQFSGFLLSELGFEESCSKAVPPSTRVTCLGVLFDTELMTMSVTPDRLLELETLLHSWSVKKSASKKQLQSLIGKLAFVCKCVRQSQLFLSRMLVLLCTVSQNHHHVKLSAEFRKDVLWRLRFLRIYNGVSVIPSNVWTEPDAIFSTDACLTGCGGLSSTHYFHAVFPPGMLQQSLAIHNLELLAILVAVRLWGHHWPGLRILVRCDNFAVVQGLNSGKARDSFLAAALRELWFVAARHEFELRAAHLSSSENRAADLLSRWHLDNSYASQFCAMPLFSALEEVIVPAEYFCFTDSV